MTTALDFLSILPLKDHSKWKANKNKHGEGNNTHPNVHSKGNNNETNILTHHEIRNVQRNKIEDWSELTVAKFLIYLFF